MSMNTEKIKVMIVDDELPIREWLKYAITSLNIAIEITGICKDGKEALALYKKNKPDICITDIKMPNMNGVELLRQVREIDHEAYMIMLTSHDDFELARQSLKFGATEYILKNEVSSEILVGIIEKYSLRNNVENSSKFRYISTYELKPYFLGELDNDDQSVIKEKLNEDQFVLTAHIKPRFDSTLFQNLGYKVEGILSGSIYKYDKTRFVFVVQLIHYSRHLEKYNTILALAKEIENLCQSAVGNCEIVDKSWTIEQAVHKSLLALGASYYDCKPYCMYTKVNENSKEAINEMILRRNKIVELINMMKFDKAIISIGDYFTYLKEEKILNIEIVKQSLSDFIASYKLYKLRFNTELLRTKASRYQEKLVGSTSIYEMELLVGRFIEDAFKVEESLEYQYSNYVNKAIAYIKEKYGAIMQIKDVSDYLGLNQEYLSRMFKAETGDTLNNYLTDQRIDVACRLLKTTNLKVNEIAEIVGYNSLSYFSRAFSKKKKQSPHDYRINQYNGKEDLL